MGTAELFVCGLRVHDEQAISAFYSRYMPCMYSYAYVRIRDEASAQDVAHNSVLAVVRNINQLDDDAKFDAWLWTIVRHEVAGFLRTQQRVVSLSDNVERRLEMSTMELSEPSLLSHTLRQSLQGLSARDRIVLFLLAESDMSTSDLAKRLNVSQENAQRLASRVRRRACVSKRALDAAIYEKRCSELLQVIAHWDGLFTPVWRKRISHHVESCAVCGRREIVL
jgi:RNA polymerase sigma factor (sigma-70 family)